MRNWIAIIVVSSLAALCAAAEPTVCGYMGDRSGVYAGCNPPAHWDDANNVLWKSPVPNLGQAAPAIGGGRVFVLSEPGWKNDLPVLSCYDAQSGERKWDKEIDHLSLTVQDDAQRASIRQAWHNHLAWIREYYLLYHDYAAAKDSPDVKRRMEAMGVEGWGANYLYGPMAPAKESEFSMRQFGKKHPEVGKALVGLDTWRCMGSHDQMWIGEVFATPVADSQGVYVATAWGVYACYGLDGAVRWMRAMPVNRPHDYCSVARSPLLYKELLLSDLGRMVRAFDRNSGELKWEHTRPGSSPHEFVSPVVFRVGGQDLLWCAGPAAYTLPEGKPLKIEGWRNNGMIVVVNRDKPDTLFFTGGGEHGGWEGKGKAEVVSPAAVRFSLEGDALTAKVLWHGINGESRGWGAMAYNEGKLYVANAGTILDAETGLVLRGLFGGAVPASGHQLAIAGGHVYGLSSGGERGALPAGVMQVHTVDGRGVARNALYVAAFAKLDADERAKRLSQWYSWPNAANREWCFSYSYTFNIAGDRIYIRSLDHLYCIGAKGPQPAAVAPAAADLDTLVKKGNWDNLAALGAAAKAAVPQIEAAIAKSREPYAAVSCLAAIDPQRAAAHRDVLVKAVAGLHDYIVPKAGELLFSMGNLSRADLAVIESAVDRKMYPHGGPKMAQQLLSACYKRSGEVGFTRVVFRPLAWEGVPQRGKEITLEWSAVNAKAVRIEPGIGAVEPVGEKALTLDKTTTFTFTAEGPGGPTTRTIVVPIRVSFREAKLDAAKVKPGAEVTITWEAVNADSVTIEPDVGKVDAKGEKKIAVTKTTEFTLTAAGPEGLVTKKITVKAE